MISPQRLSNETATVKPQGILTAANATELEKQLLEKVTSRSYSEILVDLSEVEFIDTASLMVLVKAFREAETLRKKFSICKITPAVKILLELTRLDKVFNISQ